VRHICPQCKEEFDRPGKKAKYCSIECRSAAKIKQPIVCAGCGKIKKHYARGLCKKCYRHQYNQAPEQKRKHAKQMRDWRKNNPEAAEEIEKRRAKTKKRKRWKAIYHQKYYNANKDSLCAYQSEYRKQHPDKVAMWKHRYNVRKRQLPNTLTDEQWEDILGRYNYSCAYCGDSEELVQEHWVPVSRGGGYTVENIVPACQSCNSSKNVMTGEEFHHWLDLREWEAIKELIQCEC
jgi:hypothetical protein